MAETATRQTCESAPFDAFREAVSTTFVPLLAEPGDAGTFRGSVTHTELGSLVLAQVAAGPHVIGRSSRLIRRADPECYKLSLQVAGRGLLSQGGQQAVLAPGDLVLYDTSHPYELRFDGAFQMIVLMFSRSLLHVPEPAVRALAGRRIPGDHGLAGLVGPFVTGLARQAGRCAVGANVALADAVLDMLAAALADELSAGAEVPNGSRQTLLLRRIKSWIEDELADPDLDPAGIAAAHHISPRYLRKLFEGEGDSVARWIRSRRLEHCRRDLARADLAHRSVSAIAARWGFTDAAHFSRLFKATYGRSPSEYRHGSSSSRPALTVVPA